MEEKIILHIQSYQQPPDTRHVDVLDGVRALCVLLVGWFHIWQQGWLAPSFYWGKTWVSLDFLLRTGYLWVDGLLLLSGFLLYLPYAQAGQKLPGALSFYKRRLIRILPSYLLCVVPMFILACVRGEYASALAAAEDLAAHLTFTFNWFRSTYFSTPINGALWTLAVEMQFYLLFPLLARCYKKAPALTYLGMTAAAFAFRYYASQQEETGMYFNQLPAFLDVYANGFLAASVFTALHKRLGSEIDGKIKIFFTAMAVICVCGILQIAQAQARESSVQLGQMARRFPFSALLACFMLCAAFSVAPMRFLLGNKIMYFLSLVSFQFYIYHQMLAVKLKEWRVVPSLSATPWSSGEYQWQVKYILLCFVLALVLATLITFLFERPLARMLRRKTLHE